MKTPVLQNPHCKTQISQVDDIIKLEDTPTSHFHEVSIRFLTPSPSLDCTHSLSLTFLSFLCFSP